MRSARRRIAARVSGKSILRPSPAIASSPSGVSISTFADLALQLRGLLFPLGHETKDVFARRLRRERLQPTNGLCADVLECVHTAGAGPEHVTCLRQIPGAVQDGFDLTAQNEVRLFICVVVWADTNARQVLDEEEPVVNRAECFVDERFQKNTLQPARNNASPFTARDLTDIEMAEKVALEVVQIKGGRIRRDTSLLLEKRIAFHPRWFRLWCRHLQPTHRGRSDRLPAVQRTDLEAAVVSGTETITLIIGAENDLSGHEVEALFVGMDMWRQHPAGRELGDAEAVVPRPRTGVHE